MRILAIAIVSLSIMAPAYALTAQPGAPEAPPSDTTKAADGDDRVVCRRVDVTGSLIKRGRVCRTVAEWRRITENGNYNARKMVDEGTTRGGGQ
jgi:hypothetical protein